MFPKRSSHPFHWSPYLQILNQLVMEQAKPGVVQALLKIEPYNSMLLI